MQRIILLAALAFAILAGTAAVVTLGSTSPAVACENNSAVVRAAAR